MLFRSISHSNVSLAAVNQLWRYFTEGGVQNFVNALEFATDTCLKTTYNPPLPQTVSRVGIYDWGGSARACIETFLPDFDAPKSRLIRGEQEVVKVPLLKGDLGGSKSGRKVSRHALALPPQS